MNETEDTRKALRVTNALSNVASVCEKAKALTE